MSPSTSAPRIPPDRAVHLFGLPSVIERPLVLEAVTRDPFIDDLADVTVQSNPAERPSR